MLAKKGTGMQYRTGAGLILSAGLLWSMQGPIISLIDQTGSWALLMWRSVGLLAVLLAYLALQGGVIRQISGLGRAGVIGALGLVLAYSGAIFAFQSTSVARAVLLFSASPFFAAILGRIFLGQKVRPVTWVSILLATLGILWMVQDGLTQNSGNDGLGDLAALGSALGFAIFTVALGRGGAMYPTIALGAFFSILTGAAMAWLLGQTIVTTGGDIGLALFMGVVTLSGGMILFSMGSRVVPAASATLMSLVEVFLAPVWMWMFFGQGIAANTALGGAIVLAAVILNASTSGSAKTNLTLGGQS